MPISVASISTLKKELTGLPKEEILNFCLKLAKYKVENKEYLNYLLYEAGDEDSFIDEVKQDIIKDFKEIDKMTMYFTKKNIRRIYKGVTKYIKFSGSKKVEVELCMCFCKQMQECGVSFYNYPVMTNFYKRLLVKIEKALSRMHEDVRVDYEDELEILNIGLK